MITDLVALKQHKFIFMNFWRPEAPKHFPGLKPKCWQDLAASRGSQGEAVLLPFPACRTAFLGGGIPLHLRNEQCSILL